MIFDDSLFITYSFRLFIGFYVLHRIRRVKIDTPICNHSFQDVPNSLLVACLQFITLNLTIAIGNLAIFNRPTKNIRAYALQREIGFLLSDILPNKIPRFRASVSHRHWIIFV